MLTARDSRRNLLANTITDTLSAANPFLSGVNEGRNGMKLPGEFSHKTNPIHFIQNGVKVGEGTGDEYVINSDQARKIAEQSKYASKLFRKFDQEA